MRPWCVSRKTFCLQVRFSSVCSLDCTSSDMFSLLCLTGHEFKTGYSSGAAVPRGQRGLPPPELCIPLRAGSLSRDEMPVGPPGPTPQPPCPYAQQPTGGNPHRSESFRAVAAALWSLKIMSYSQHLLFARAKVTSLFRIKF